MNLLAIDTSTEQASIALSLNGVCYVEEIRCQKTQAEVMLPIIDGLLKKAKASLKQLDALVFGCGPGSFTGLRISCSIAKGLAYALDCPLIPVSSLAAIAWLAREQLNDPKLEVLSVIDARMGELYWAVFNSIEDEPKEEVSKSETIFIAGDAPIVLAGVGFSPYWDQLPSATKERITQSVTVFPCAAAMIDMVTQLNLPRVAVAEAKPVYVRNRVTQGDFRG